MLFAMLPRLLRLALLCAPLLALRLSVGSVASAAPPIVVDTLPASLAGTWQIAFGDPPGGVASLAGLAFRDVAVPGLWQQQGLSEEHGTVWYRVELELTTAARRSPLAFTCARIRDVDEVYLDGVPVGKTGRFPPRYDKGTLVPRLYEIPVDLTRDPGRHVLVIRVHNAGPRPGGLESVPRLEALVPALRRESAAELRTAILAAVLASLGFFALLLFARNRGSDELLWFSLFAFGTAVFQTIWLPSVTHSGLPLTLLFRFSIAGAFFLPGLFAIFMLRFFDRELTRGHLALFATLGLFSLACFVWPVPDALYRLLPVAYVFVTAIVAVTFQILIRDARRGLPYARVLLPVLALLALAVFHDIADDLGLFGAHSLDARLYGPALLVFLSVVMLLMAERFARLRLAASTDPLTSLANRGALFDRTNLEIARAKRRLHHVALAILDVDHFKRWNDRFGHVAGDRLLVAVAKALRESVRDTDLAARFGGEEFVVLLPETDEAQAMVVLERIRQAVAAIRLPGIAEGVTISSGLSVLEPSITTSVAPSSWLRRADGALYKAKAGGRNRIVVATRAPGGSSASGSGIRPLSGTSRGA